MSTFVETSDEGRSEDTSSSSHDGSTSSPPTTIYYRITGKQSVERLDPLFQGLNNHPVLEGRSVGFRSIATYPDNKLLSTEETQHVLSLAPTLQPFFLWETTCEKDLKSIHQQATIRNKLINNTVLESKANFAFLQYALPADLQLATYVANNATEVLDWCRRRWSHTSPSDTSSTAVPSTTDWWVVKASAGNGGRDIWMVHAHNYESELHDLPVDQEYVLQRYVARPLLYKGSKKFHFRCYGLCRGDGQSWLYQNSFILTAGLDYNEDTTDTKRHITNLSVNKHIPKHPGQIPCHIPTEYPELYPRIQRLWSETVSAAVPFMRQPSSCALDFEFCGLDVIADVSGNCWLIEINRLPGLESSKINTAEEDVMYNQMMDECLWKMFVQPWLTQSSSIHEENLTTQGTKTKTVPYIIGGLWDDVTKQQHEGHERHEGHETAGRAVISGPKDEKEIQQITLGNLLRWKMFRQRHRKLVLAQFN